jgi:predicted aldo/keto reductase-like oxidoreductase
VHSIQGREDIEAVLKPGGAVEAFEAARKAGKCRFIGFTGHFDPEAHAALLNAYDGWDTVMMPVHAADEQIALPVAAERGGPTQAMKIFGKAHLLRSLSSGDCLRYALSQPSVQVAICGCGTVGQMEDNIRAVQDFHKMTPEECEAVRKRANSGAGVYTGTTLEYWKKEA